jgi:hypothetical protein
MALDLGFDPRAHDMLIDLPADATSVTVELDGEPVMTTGDRACLRGALVEAGFNVTEP